jgi:hypothetical protein
MLDRNAIVAIYHHHAEANEAIGLLSQAEFEPQKLSMVAKDRLGGGRVMTDDHADGRGASWGKLGLFGPGLWGRVFGWASFWIPGMGPLLLGGPIVPAILGAHDGAAVFGDLNAVGVGFYRIGIPKQSIRRYERAIRQGRYLLIVHGTEEEVMRAGRIVSSTGAELVALHTQVNLYQYV